MAIRTDPRFARRIETQMKPIIHLFTPIFFVVVGLSLDLRGIDWGSPFVWWFSLVMFVLAVAGKLLGGQASAEGRRRALLIGLAMVPRGEVGLIFVELGRTAGILQTEVHTALVIVIALTTFLPPLVMRALYRRSSQLGAPAGRFDQEE